MNLGMAMNGDAFEQYLDHLAAGLGHADRVRRLKEYCTGLMLPLPRKSVEPLAAHLDPFHVSARHQALLHFVGQSPWSDEAILERIFLWVQPLMAQFASQWFWIVDDTGLPKKGKHSVGVARQYCGQIGKQDNCQVAVSLSLATAAASLPIAWQLYLPESWCDDVQRCQAAGIPEPVRFATKPQLALDQMWRAKAAGVPIGTVVADAAYGNECPFREGLEALGLEYAVGIGYPTTVWAPGTAPLPAKPDRGTGKPATLLKRDAQHQPVSAKNLALSLPPGAWRTITWREGSNAMLRSRFARVRARPAHRDYWRSQLRAEAWLLVEWPQGEPEPTKYWLSNLSAAITMDELVATAKMRWQIERDYEELKQEFGLGHYEGRGWRGFHHHATLCIAAYGFLLGQRLCQKKASQRPPPSLSEGDRPRRASSRTTPCP
jgi:SRSO17 transposase